MQRLPDLRDSPRLEIGIGGDQRQTVGVEAVSNAGLPNLSRRQPVLGVHADWHICIGHPSRLLPNNLTNSVGVGAIN